jgi:hypothetical protein
MLVEELKDYLDRKISWDLCDHEFKRYENIIESLVFAVNIKSPNKIDYEFNKMLKFMNHNDCERKHVNTVIVCWDIFKKVNVN